MFNFSSRLLIFYFVPLLFYEDLLNNFIKFHCHIFNNYLVLTISFTDTMAHFIGMLCYISVRSFALLKYQNFFVCVLFSEKVIWNGKLCNFFTIKKCHFPSATYFNDRTSASERISLAPYIYTNIFLYSSYININIFVFCVCIAPLFSCFINYR